MYIMTSFHYTDHEDETSESSDPPSAYSNSGMYGSRHVLDWIYSYCGVWGHKVYVCIQCMIIIVSASVID